MEEKKHIIGDVASKMIAEAKEEADKRAFVACASEIMNALGVICRAHGFAPNKAVTPIASAVGAFIMVIAKDGCEKAALEQFAKMIVAAADNPEAVAAAKALR